MYLSTKPASNFSGAGTQTMTIQLRKWAEAMEQNLKDMYQFILLTRPTPFELIRIVQKSIFTMPTMGSPVGHFSKETYGSGGVLATRRLLFLPAGTTVPVPLIGTDAFSTNHRAIFHFLRSYRHLRLIAVIHEDQTNQHGDEQD